jgi:hypothetical protein
MRAVRHDAGDNNQVKRDNSRQCQFLDKYLQTNLAAEKFLRQIRAAKYAVQTRRSSSRCGAASSFNVIGGRGKVEVRTPFFDQKCDRGRSLSGGSTLE